MAPRVLIALLLVGAGACTTPELKECTLRCGVGDTCPTAYHAVCGADHYCHAEDKVGQLCAGDGGLLPDLLLIDATGLDFTLLPDGSAPPDIGDGGVLPGDGTAPKDGGVVDPFTRIALGDTHTCGLRQSGALYCWGENSRGELGDTTNLGKTIPTRVGPTTLWQAVALGQEHTCAIRADTTLWCWGWNDQGKLGSAGGDTNQPRQVTLIAGVDTGWSAISLGRSHSCGVHQGSLFCWGYNDAYRLGDNTTNTRPLPVQIAPSMNDWTQVSVGVYHTCGLRGAGTLYCWGSGDNDKLGDNGVVTEARTPMVIGTDNDWTEISLGEPWSCGIRQNQVHCWGNNAYYYNFSHAAPFPIDGSSYHGLSSGLAHSCALRNGSNNLYCWGANDAGQIGSGTFSIALMPTLVDNNAWEAVGAGGFGHTCGLRNGVAYCWGKNNEGQLGLGVTSDKHAPVNVRAGDKFLDVSAGEAHSCAIRDDGTLWCWGLNDDGQVGASNGIRHFPTPLQLSNTGWEQVEVGASFSCAVRNISGTRHIYCWGWNGGGQLGNGSTTDSYDPVEAAFTPPSLALPDPLTVGGHHGCGLQSGGLWCWGFNYYGQLGLGMTDMNPHGLPLQVGTATNWRAIGGHDVATCAASPTGLYCWGTWNDLDHVAGPMLYDPSTSWMTVTMGGFHVCGIWADKSVHCKGSNSYGQLGNSTDTDWASVDAGYTHTCALRTTTGANASQLWCWGENDLGQLGLGNKVLNRPPTRVGTSTWSSLSVGRDHTCAIQLADKSLWCWGDNTYGQVGDGTGSVLTPAAVK